jgi:hypothetical protein
MEEFMGITAFVDCHPTMNISRVTASEFVVQYFSTMAISRSA